MKINSLYFVALCLAGCVASDKPIPINTVSLAKIPDGTRVTVHGFLIFESHARHLWRSEIDAEDNSNNCITLVNTTPFKQDLQRKSRSMVTITGRIYRDALSGMVDLGACSKTGLILERIGTVR
jgi:hypothetical protein